LDGEVYRGSFHNLHSAALLAKESCLPSIAWQVLASLLYFISFLVISSQFVASLVLMAWIFLLVAGYHVAIKMVDVKE